MLLTNALLYLLFMFKYLVVADKFTSSFSGCLCLCAASPLIWPTFCVLCCVALCCVIVCSSWKASIEHLSMSICLSVGVFIYPTVYSHELPLNSPHCSSRVTHMSYRWFPWVLVFSQLKAKDTLKWVAPSIALSSAKNCLKQQQNWHIFSGDISSPSLSHQFQCKHLTTNIEMHCKYFKIILFWMFSSIPCSYT